MSIPTSELLAIIGTAATGNSVVLQLAWVDYLILSVYFAFVLGIGRVLKNHPNSKGGPPLRKAAFLV
jgi:SSS family solute:Na+ symporter